MTVEMVFYVPIVRLDQGKYLIGTKEKQVSITNASNQQAVVRTGGGYMKMQEYLKYYSKYECTEISKVMRHSNEGYKAAVLKLIQTHEPEDKRVIEAWERRCKDSMTDIFKGLLSESKDLEARIE